MSTPLTRDQLYHSCDPDSFSFSTTAELEVLEQPIGQQNALDAVDFAANIKQNGYNLYAMGPSGSGKHSAIMSFLQKKSAQEPMPRSEEHTSELQSRGLISYAVFCLKKKKQKQHEI